MKTSPDFPPNYEEILKVFDLKGTKPVFCYGDSVYGVQEPLPDYLMIHEETHMVQQIDPKAWWDQYLKDPAFRLEQELEAYQAEYRYLVKMNNPQKELLLESMAWDLCGPMYGNLLPFGDVKSKIRQNVTWKVLY